jgi:acyl-CoA synthetase (AMP-forming)/AMP-acid ligase II
VAAGLQGLGVGEGHRVAVVLPNSIEYVGQVGEILVRSKIPNRVFGGYWNTPAATAEAARDGWYHTGDNIGLMRYYASVLTEKSIRVNTVTGAR